MELQYCDNQNGSNSSGNEFARDNSYQSNLIPPSNNQFQNQPQYYNQYPPAQPIYSPQPQPLPYPPYLQPQVPPSYPNSNIVYQSNDFANTLPQPQGNVAYNQSNTGESYQVSNKNEIKVVNPKISIIGLIVL